MSFIASFFEFETDKNLILLLDEPGLSLHARAQMDLLGSIDNELSRTRQVLYTTHSPFMVRTSSIDRVRIVEDRGPDKGAIVTNDAGTTSDPDTLFPLQAALGYDIAQNLFIGNRNVLLEGVSDLVYLSIMSSHLESQQRQFMPEDARLLPVGGATSIPTFVALLGTELDVVVLLDGNSPRQKIKNAIAQGRLSLNRVLDLSSFCAVKGADIEDLFTPGEYLDMYNAAFDRTHTEQELQGNDRIVKRIERAEDGEFDHGKVAAYFARHQAVLVPKLSDATVTRFEDVIKAISAALPTMTTAVQVS